MNITNWSADKIAASIMVASAEHRNISEPKMIARDGCPRLVRMANQVPTGPRAIVRPPQVSKEGHSSRRNLAEQFRTFGG